MTTLSAAILLFLIMDPLGNIPIFLSLLKDVAPKRRRLVLIRELLIGILMVFPPADGGGIFGKPGEGEPFIVPMAIPGVAGPSAMAALLLLTNTQPGRTADWAIALLGAWLATAVILLCSTYLFRYLGESVLTALERVMGMLLIALSVQMFLGGVAAYLHLTV
jgi:small neutral amino acid transporter SnatA (MarC family)